jgi:amino acid adenylation domain-containing protein
MAVSSQPALLNGVAPLSYAQEALYYLHEAAPQSTAYHIARALVMPHATDVEALRRAVAALVARHAILRTAYPLSAAGGRTQQIVLNPPPVFQVIPLPETADLQTHLQAETGRPFDLEHGEVLRVRWLAPPAGRPVLLFVIHHIAADMHSLRLLLAELADLYHGAEPRPQPVPYAIHAIRQRQSQPFQLPRKPEPLDLPQDHSPGGIVGIVGSAQARPAQVSSFLRQPPKIRNTTQFTILMAACQVWLSRLTGQSHVSIATPVSARTPEFQDTIGYFVNPTILQADLSADPKFPELLPPIRQAIAKARRTPQHPQPVQAMFAYHHLPEATPVLLRLAAGWETTAVPFADLEAEAIPIPVAPQFEITLTVTAGKEEILIALDYDSSRLEPATAQSLLEAYQTLLDSISANPQARVSDLALAKPATPQTIPQDYPVRCLHERVAAQAAATPSATALIAGSTTWTYAELDSRSNRWANYLRQKGGRPESLIAVCLDRTAELAAVLLGILKSGAAYLPLDPRLPPARLALLLEDAQAMLVITRESLRSKLPETAACITIENVPLASQNAGPVTAVHPQNLAYMIYTSGSTGQPKGVAITHANADALIEWALGTYRPCQLAGVLASTSIAFDLSIFELFVPWGAGGAVILIDSLLDLPNLQGAPEITLINTVPSVLAEMLRGCKLPPHAKVVNLAGEPLPQSLAERLHQDYPGIEVWNLYGPSEDTTYSTAGEVPRDDPRPPSIGAAIRYKQAFILDEKLRPVPQGVRGELYLSGAGLARGYLGRPALTATRWIAHPYSAEPGARLYRTGDLARLRPDGGIEFLGRADQQVKLRGFRIELGEIENVLGRHPAVSACAVAVQEAAGKSLCAYVVFKEGPIPEEQELRQYLLTHLPDYMVPAFFLKLDSLPRTATGKLDRRALPAKAPLPAPRAAAAYVEPRTPLEKQIAALWCEVLGVDRIGIETGFFHHGGHSLQAARMLARLREIDPVQVPLPRFLEEPTINGIARYIEVMRGAAAGEMLGPIPSPACSNSAAPLPLSCGQEQLWFLDQWNGGNTAYLIPLLIRLRGTLDIAVLERALSRIVERHAPLRTTFALLDGKPVQRIGAPRGIALARLDLRDVEPPRRESALAEISRRESASPLDLARGPLLRATLVALAHDDHALLLTLHHIAADGWSLRVLLGEMQACYTTGLNGAEPELPPLPAQYAGWTLWQRRWLESDACREQLDYWKRQLSGLEPKLFEPDSLPGTPSTASGACHPVAVSPAARAALEAIARNAGATPFIILLSAFQVLLARWSGRTDIAVGTPVAGRTHRDLENLIGMFANTLVLRSDLGGNPIFGDLLAHTRATVFAAQAHQDAPFEKVVQALAAVRTGQNPLFQVMFVFDDMPAGDLSLPGLEVTVHEAGGRAAKFDLLLSLRAAAGGYTGYFEYDPAQLAPSTVRQIADAFACLLDAIPGHAGTSILDLPLTELPNPRPVAAAPPRPVTPAACVAPLPPDFALEHQLRLLFAEVLGRPDVAPAANFFTLGGHSLLAARLSARVREALGVELPIRAIFEHPSVADLALVIRELPATQFEGIDLTALLSEVENLTDEEVARRLAQHSVPNSTQP